MSGGIAPPIQTLALEVRSQLHIPVAVPWVNTRAVLIEQGAGWATELVGAFCTG